MLSRFRKMNYLLPSPSKPIFIGIYIKGHVPCVTNVKIKYDMPILYYEIIKIRFNTKASQ